MQTARSIAVAGLLGLLSIVIFVLAVILSSDYELKPTNPVTVAELQQKLNDEQPATATETPKSTPEDNAIESTPLPSGINDSVATDPLPTSGPANMVALLAVVFLAGFLFAEAAQLLGLNKQTK